MGIFKYLGDQLQKPGVIPQLVTGNVVGAAIAAYPEESAQAAVGMVKNTAKTFVQFPRAAVAGAAGLMGMQDLEASASKPLNVPLLGQVKGLSAKPGDIEKYGTQTPTETAVQAANIYLEGGMPGVSKVVGKVAKMLPKSSKVGEALSGVNQATLEAAATPEIAQRIEKLREAGMTGSPEQAVQLGQEAFDTAQGVKKQAMDAYRTTKEALIAKKGSKIIERFQDFADGVNSVLRKNKIKFTENGVNLTGSAFEGSASAKTALDRANGIMGRPIMEGANAVDDLLTRREAITSILDEVPPAEKNLRRVLNDMKKSFDATLETAIGKEATALRENYAKAMQPTEDVIKGMTKDGKFSPDKARAFMEQAMSGVKFDRSAMLSELDKIAGTEFSKIAEAIGIDKAINQLSPATKSRVFDVLKTFVIAKLPFVSALVSPKFWGEVSLAKGMKSAVNESKAFQSWLMSNILTAPIRATTEVGANRAAETSFQSQFGAEPVDAASATVDNFSDEDFANTFGAEAVQ